MNIGPWPTGRNADDMGMPPPHQPSAPPDTVLEGFAGDGAYHTQRASWRAASQPAPSEDTAPASHEHACNLDYGVCTGLHRCECGHEWHGDPWPARAAKRAASQPAPAPSEDSALFTDADDENLELVARDLAAKYSGAHAELMLGYLAGLRARIAAARRGESQP